MPNYKQLGKAAGYAMKYKDVVSPGTFREDAPAQKFKKMELRKPAVEEKNNPHLRKPKTTTTTTTNKKPSTTELIAARKARSGKSTATTKPVARSGKWKPGDPKYPAWVGTGGSGSSDAYLLKGNVAMQNWIESSKQKSWPKNK